MRQPPRRESLMMNTNFLPYDLPKTVTVDGICVPIRWDFGTALRFMEYVETSQDDDETFVRTVLEIWYPTVPNNLDEALTQVIRFYCGGDLPKEGYYSPFFSPQENKEDIFRFFLNRFGIDLRTETLHWWTARQYMNHYRRRGNYGSEYRT